MRPNPSAAGPVTPRRRAATLAVVLLLAGSPAVAQPAAAGTEPADRAAEIDAIFSWAAPDAPGCAVAVAREGKVVLERTHGLADLERGTPIGPDTLFDAGSVVKQFVAAAVLLLVDEGRLSLDGDIRAHLPELPDYGHKVTIDHLLTHTSGLRDWTALLMFSDEDEDAMSAILRQRGLNFPPGEEWSYSNSGYVLLKELIARAAGVPFSRFADERLFKPLGMSRTRYEDEPRPGVDNLALAYEKRGDRWEQDMMLGKERGGGALLTTAPDLLLWNEAIENAALGAFVTEKLQEPARLNNGRELGYARGLFLDENPGGRVIWHSGSAGAYKAMLARFPEQRLSIAILSNAGDTAQRTLSARRLYDVFVPGVREAAGEPADEGVSVPADQLAARAGLFLSDAARPLRLGVEEGRLRVLGGPVLVAESPDRFRNPEAEVGFLSGDRFELRFLSPDEFDLISMEGEATRYRRARPGDPAPESLQAFAGRYESRDLNAVLEIAPGDDGLVVRLNDSPPFAFPAVAPDTFLRGMMTLRFRRDGDGSVAGLLYNNPVLRDVAFTPLPREE